MRSDTTSCPVIRLRGVSVLYDAHTALADVDLAAHAGRLMAVVGANGSGKSTLLAVLAGLRAPDAGTVERAPGIRVAFVPQTTSDAARLPLTVTDLVAMGRWSDRGPFRPLRRADRDRVAEAIELVGLGALARRPLADLSGGQRQRAFLGQALAQDADLLLLDEPMSGLDAASRDAAAVAVRAVAERGAAVVAVTHDLAELDGVDDVIGLVAGRVADSSDMHGHPRGRILGDAASVRA